MLERYRFKPVDLNFIPELREDKVNHCLLLNDKDLIKFSGYDFRNPIRLYSYKPLELQWVVDKNGIIWLADGNKFVQINLRTGSIRNFIPADASQARATNATTDLYTDRTGIMWIATGGYGVLKYDPEIELFLKGG